MYLAVGIFVLWMLLTSWRLRVQGILLVGGLVGSWFWPRFLLSVGVAPGLDKWIVTAWLAYTVITREILLRRQDARACHAFYDDIEQGAPAKARIGYGEARLNPGRDKTYEVFLSYKSQNVHLVRCVADAMIASGLRVWFAEYTILLVARDQFERFIRDGIAQSQRGVCFTNDRFVSSPYCRSELEQLLKLSELDPCHVIEVTIPKEAEPHARYPQLASVPSLEFHGDSNELLGRLAEKLGVAIDPLPALSVETELPRRFDVFGKSFSLQMALWDVKEETFRKPLVAGQCCSFCQNLDGYTLQGNLIVGKDYLTPRSWEMVEDDRRCYDASLRYAEEYCARWARQCRGVHLFFLHGFSHPVITYSWKGGWHRRYSVVLPMPGGYAAGLVEFAFVFRVVAPFQTYCRYVHMMDSLVGSLQWI